MTGSRIWNWLRKAFAFGRTPAHSPVTLDPVTSRSATLRVVEEADMGSWRSFGLPWVVDLPDPEDRPREIDGYLIRWDAIRVDHDRDRVWFDQEILDSALLFQKAAQYDGVGQIGMSFRQRKDKVVISIKWDEYGDHEYSVDLPDTGEVNQGIADLIREMAVQGKAHAEAIRLVLQANYPNRDFSQITDKQISDFVTSGKLARCGPCTENPEKCTGPTCTFLRAIGEDPALGYRQSPSEPSEILKSLPDSYMDPNVDNRKIAEMIRGALYRRQKMPES